MKVVFDVEANSLVNPSKIWVIVCKEIGTPNIHIFREVSDNEEEKKRFIEFAGGVTLWVGHNILDYDVPHILRLLGCSLLTFTATTGTVNVIDTLIVSRLLDYSRKQGHSIEAYGEEFGYPKLKFNDFKQYSKEMEDYCVRDTEICEKVYNRYVRYLLDPCWAPSLDTEHRFQLEVNSLHDNGFCFNRAGAERLLEKVSKELEVLDKDILEAFPPREVLIREFTPKETKYGTISKTSVPRSLWDNISDYSVGNTYRHTRMEPFNPSSHKQIIAVLNEAGWKPENKTQTHIDTEREINRLKYTHGDEKDVALIPLSDKLNQLKISGWKVDEHNLGTLPETAPPSARFLAKRILLESRRRTLTEWLGLVDDGRIHGRFYGIGAWTHRMAHQRPNTANIPSPTNLDGSTKLFGKEMRSLWIAPRNRLLVGVDAEGIQLRIFAHYIDDPEFTRSLVEGKKDDKTDPHSLNQRILGSVCKSRAAAKRFIYALLLGAGHWKLSQILECDERGTREALDRLLERYTGFATLKTEVIPADAQRGWFLGLDGRKVRIPGETQGERKHLCMSGYLQNGEAVVMKKAALRWHKQLEDEGIKGWKFVNMVHDEWQTEVPNNMETALRIAKVQADSLRIVGEELSLKCPLAGSYWNEDKKDYTIGTNWYTTH